MSIFLETEVRQRDGDHRLRTVLRCVRLWCGCVRTASTSEDVSVWTVLLGVIAKNTGENYYSRIPGDERKQSCRPISFKQGVLIEN